jgi:hypothetical protein
MFDRDWDPYDAMINLDRNVQNLIAAHNLLAKRVEEQGHVIDILTEGLQKSNKANELLMRDLMSNITQKLNEVK